MNRREFFIRRRLASVAGPVLAIAGELETPPAASSEPVLLRYARRAMATTFEVIVPFGTPDAHQAASRPSTKWIAWSATHRLSR